jgi:3-hydroxybutyrate dehydrogenase
MMTNLTGKTAVVTGSTSGIGLSYARAFAKAGANVVINGMGDADAIEKERKAIETDFAVKAVYSPADMLKPAEIAEMIKLGETTFGSVDILVNNAGIQFVSPVEDFPVEKWDAIIGINLSSAFHGIRAVVPGMKKRGWGRIINTASAHSLVASPFKSAYVAAKHGIAGLTKTVALELATHKITCNCISPGYVWTPLVEKQIPDTMKARGLTKEQVINDVLLAAQPTKQFVTPEQVAALAVYLCGDDPMTTLLEVQRLSKSFGGLRVTDDVSFSLASGDRVALIGPNGAGKTTLVNQLSGDLAPSDGRILLAGQDVTTASIPERVRGGLVRTFQVTRLFTSLTVAENVALAVMQRRGLTKRMFSSVMDKADVRDEWQSVLSLLGIGHLAATPVTKLAYGQQRLLDLAIGLAMKPRVLVLDEPAAGVPHDESPRILEAIGRMSPEIAILMIEHDMDLVFKFARRVLVLANGALIFEGTPAEVKENDAVRAAYLGNYANARRTS